MVRHARITDQKYAKYSGVLSSMGLEKQEFRIIGWTGSQVTVHPDDVSKPRREPLTVRRDIVEFMH